eukprot:308770-Prorocentrum_minimum.AAC.1
MWMWMLRARMWMLRARMWMVRANGERGQTRRCERVKCVIGETSAGRRPSGAAVEPCAPQNPEANPKTTAVSGPDHPVVGCARACFGCRVQSRVIEQAVALTSKWVVFESRHVSMFRGHFVVVTHECLPQGKPTTSSSTACSSGGTRGLPLGLNLLWVRNLLVFLSDSPPSSSSEHLVIHLCRPANVAGITPPDHGSGAPVTENPATAHTQEDLP